MVNLTMSSMKTCYSLPIISLVAMWGCGNSGNKNNNGDTISEDDRKVIVFDMSRDVEDIFSLDILEEPIMLNLAHDSILIGEPSQSVYFRNRIYLLDENTANKRSIVIVGENGRVHRQIEKTGRGPLEYLTLDQLFIDRKMELLGAYSRGNPKIVYFDLDGNVRQEIEMPKRFMDVWPIYRGFAGYMGNFGEDKERRDNLWLMDDSLGLRESFFEIPASWESVDWVYSPFSEYGGDVYYTRLLDNDVYTIGEDGVSAKYSFDFGENNWPESKRDYEDWVRITGVHPVRYIGKLERIQETDGYVVIQFLHEGQTRLGIYNKKSGESTVCSADVYTGKYFIPFGTIVGIDADAVYTMIPAYQVLRMWNGKDEYNDFEAKYPDQIRRLREDFPKIDEYGNPFLVIYRFEK